MIDRAYRNELKELLMQFHSGAITNTQLIDLMDDIGGASADPAIDAIIGEAEVLFDDTMFNTYRMSEQKASDFKPFVARLIDFLGTDIEYSEESANRRRISPKVSSDDQFFNTISLGIYGMLVELIKPRTYAKTPEELWGSWPFPNGHNEASKGSSEK